MSTLRQDDPLFEPQIGTATTSSDNPRADRIPAHANRVLIAANPCAGAGGSTSLASRLAAALHTRRMHAQVITNLDELSQTIRAAQHEGKLRAVVAAGGDGTLQELVNRTTPDTPLAIFPLGTANLLAHHWNIKPWPDEFAEMLLAGNALRLDAGRATWLGAAARSDSAAGDERAAATPSADETMLPAARRRASVGRAS